MSDTVDSTPADTGAPQAAPASVADQPATRDADLDSLLRQYEEGTAAKPKAEPAPAPADAASTYDKAVADHAAEQQRQTADAALREQIGALSRTVANIQAKEREQLERADFGRVVAAANEDLAEQFPHLPPDFAEMWFMREAVLNDELRQAWDHRYDSEQAKAWATSRVKRALRKMHEAAKKSNIDPDATGDRMAVAAAVRGSGRAPADTPRNFAKLTDAEFRAEKDKMFGSA